MSRVLKYIRTNKHTEIIYRSSKWLMSKRKTRLSRPQSRFLECTMYDEDRVGIFAHKDARHLRKIT